MGKKHITGGIAVAQQKKLTKISEKFLKDILNLYGMTSARVVIREDVTSEQIVDHISGNKTYAKAITILNKIDLVDDTFLKGLKSQISKNVSVSASSDSNIDQLRERIYKELRFLCASRFTCKM